MQLSQSDTPTIVHEDWMVDQWQTMNAMCGQSDPDTDHEADRSPTRNQLREEIEYLRSELQRERHRRQRVIDRYEFILESRGASPDDDQSVEDRASRSLEHLSQLLTR